MRVCIDNKPMKKSIFLFLLINCLAIVSKAQVKFELIATAKQDTVFYSLKYHGHERFNGNSITCNWFTMRESVYFFSAYWNGSLNYRRYVGPFPGNKYTFNHKVSAGYNFDVDLDSGQQEMFAFCENFDNIPDTVLVGNLDVYGSFGDSAVKYSVFPTTQSDCPFERVFVQAGLSIFGIQLGSFANNTLHQSTQCKMGVVGIVFDKYTLKPTTLGSILPSCPDGRKWKSFGYPKDEQLFFNFDFMTDSGQTYFSDFVDAIDPDDHVFLVTATRTPFGKPTTKLKNALKKLGISDAQYSTIEPYISPDKQGSDLLAAYGRKGMSAGKMKFFAGRENAYKQYEIFLLPNQPKDTVFSFAPCYEVLTRKIMERQPKPSSVHVLDQYRFTVFPNPTTQNWNILSPQSQKLVLYNAQLQVEKIIEIDANMRTQIDASNLAAGVYFLKGQYTTLKLVKSTN